jgi:hypothetical protein
MELLTIVLSGLLSVFATSGSIVDYLVEQNFRDLVVKIERQAIRVDNSPSYQIISGKVQKVRVATRGIELKSNLRIEALELETDNLAFDRHKLKINNLEDFRAALQQPLQGAVRLVLKGSDLNRALASSQVKDNLQIILNRLLASRSGSTNLSYELLALQLELQPENYVGLKFKLRRPSLTGKKIASELDFALNLKIRVVDGKRIELLEPSGTVNQRPMSSRLLKGFAEGISDRLDLTKLETNGIIIRLLQLEVKEDKIQLAGFARMATTTNKSPTPQASRSL